MSLSKGRLTVLSSLAMMMAVVLLVSVACGDDATSTPVVVKETVEVTKVVEVTREVPVKETVEVTKEVRETVIVTPTPQPTATTAPAAPPAPSGKVTVVQTTFGQEKLDKSLSGDLGYVGAMYDFFIGAEQDGQLSFDWGILESLDTTDGQVYTAKLKEGATWHDGVEVTSDDIKFSLEHYAREASTCIACGFVKSSLDRVEIVDKYTARIHLTQPNVTFIPNLGPLEADLTILPKHHFEKVGIDGGFEDDPLGSGPFRFVDRNIGEFIEFEANEAYWDPVRTPTIATLLVIVASEASTRVALLRTGGADISEVDLPDVNRMAELGFRIGGPQNIGSATFMFLRSFEPDQLANKIEFRKALIQSVNWTAIAQAFYPVGTEDVPLGTPLFTPAALGYDPSLPPYPFDPEGAKTLLEQSGYDGEKVSFWSWVITGNPTGLDVPQAITSAWRDVGINAEIVPVELGTFIGKVRVDPQDFGSPVNVTLTAPSARPSMLNNIRIFMASHAAGGLVEGYFDQGFIDSSYNELIAITDINALERRLRELNRQLYDTYWAAPVALRSSPYAMGQRIADWRPGNGGPIYLRYETIRLK